MSITTILIAVVLILLGIIVHLSIKNSKEKANAAALPRTGRSIPIGFISEDDLRASDDDTPVPAPAVRTRTPKSAAAKAPKSSKPKGSGFFGLFGNKKSTPSLEEQDPILAALRAGADVDSAVSANGGEGGGDNLWEQAQTEHVGQRPPVKPIRLDAEPTPAPAPKAVRGPLRFSNVDPNTIPTGAGRTPEPAAPTDTERDEDDLRVPVRTEIPEHIPVSTDKPVTPKRIPTDDDDEGPVDFSGMGTPLAAEEQERLLRELEEQLNEHTVMHEATPAPQPEPVIEAAHDAAQTAAAVAEQPAPAAPVAAPVEAAQAAAAAAEGIVKSYRWTTFMGEDAQSLGAAERRNLIKMLRDMHDQGFCLQILMDAFQEEDPNELRPAVVEAIFHSYNGEYMRELYAYCADHGSDEEKRIAQQALLSLEGAA